MRLLMTADAVGGVWTYALELAAALPAEVTLAVLGPAPDAGQRREAEAAGARLIETGLPLDWLCDGPGPVLAAGAALARLAREVGADAVHLNSPALAAEGGFGVPVVAVNHGCLGTWWEGAGKGPVDAALGWLPDLVGRGLRAADRTVAPSRAYAEATARRYGLAVPPAAVHNGRTPMPLPQAEPFRGALTIGRLWDEVKDTPTLDTAAARLDAPFVAIGSTRAPHGATVVPRHLQDLGPLPAAGIAAWLARRPVFVSAARFEPFGLAVLEAAQAGCPLVLSDIATFRELWDDAALFVPPGDAPGFATAISALLSDRARFEEGAEAARTRAARYTPAATAAAMTAIYRDAIQHRRSAA